MPRKPKTKHTQLPAETAALMVAMAEVSGVKETAAFFQVVPKTIWNWRQKVLADARLSEIYTVEKERLAAEWRDAANRAARAGCMKLAELFPQATVEQLREVAGAVHLLLDKLIVKDAVPFVGLQPHHRKDPGAAANAGRSGPAGGPAATSGATAPAAGATGTAVH